MGGEAGVWEDCGIEGGDFDRLGNCVRAGMNIAAADIGGWESDGGKVGLEGGERDADVVGGVADSILGAVFEE